MGLFSAIKNNWEKSKASVVVQNLFEMTSGTLLEIDDPGGRANKLVNDAWEILPDVFNGRFGHRPHKIAVAAFALAKGSESCNDVKTKFHYLRCLSQILAEVETNAVYYNFSQLDIKLFNESADICCNFTEKYLDKPKEKNEVTNKVKLKLNDDDKISEIIDFLSTLLQIQLSLSISNHIDMYKLGYLKGFIDNGVQIFYDIHVVPNNNEAGVETMAIAAIVLSNVLGKKRGAKAMNTVLNIDKNPPKEYEIGMYKGAEDIAKFLASSGNEHDHYPMGLLDMEDIASKEMEKHLGYPKKNDYRTSKTVTVTCVNEKCKQKLRLVGEFSSNDKLSVKCPKCNSKFKFIVCF